MRDNADDASDVFRHRKNDATNRMAIKLYMAAAVLFVIEMAAVLFSHI
ncbi:hypothetical protein J6X09_00295 [Candidatus Saccharibacteria bacterium]|nr:hypothetical protein [Candidatus Saccharibacteria bacterium]